MSTFTKSRRVALGFRSARNISRDKKRLDLDMLVKILGIAFTPITILIGINQYNHGVEREFRKNYYERQMLVYNELIELCSKIAISDIDSVETAGFFNLETKLNENYHGKLSLFENVDVENKVSDFIGALQQFKRDNDSEQIIDNDAMKQKCFLITQACRRSLAQTYNVNLKELEFSIEDSSTRKLKVSPPVAIVK